MLLTLLVLTLYNLFMKNMVAIFFIENEMLINHFMLINPFDAFKLQQLQLMKIIAIESAHMNPVEKIAAMNPPNAIMLTWN